MSIFNSCVTSGKVDSSNDPLPDIVGYSSQFETHTRNQHYTDLVTSHNLMAVSCEHLLRPKYVLAI